ncbi:hypothetical protein V7114_06605 [Neobacillus niacini]
MFLGMDYTYLFVAVIAGLAGVIFVKACIVSKNLRDDDDDDDGYWGW